MLWETTCKAEVGVAGMPGGKGYTGKYSGLGGPHWEGKVQELIKEIAKKSIQTREQLRPRLWATSVSGICQEQQGGHGHAWMERRVARDKVGARPSSQDKTTRLCYSLVSWGPPELGLGLCLMALGFYTYELLKEGVACAHMPLLHAWEPHSMGHDTRSFPFVLSLDLHSLEGKS